MIVKGVFRGGPNDRGELLSPASFVAFDYRKGHGPRRFPVETGTSRDGEFFVNNSGGISPQARERWLLLGKFKRNGEFRPDICLGTERQRAAPQPPG